jgi:hypothetical protein
MCLGTGLLEELRISVGFESSVKEESGPTT